ncbi:50S ribosomal protein L6 [Candidatus Tremblaya phenacola]|uniref:50S ribosomal protein L6 n=1 Tax=Candidatus Tremblayella phenacoccinincola TaxID=1010676 RepID=UPI0013305F7E|nr:50S ribosomal protein L6 [Candidatus Tremblaya phenacola]KAH0998252.1 LSU ribosomal protein L6p [Candidatus Tremblaya phenacola]
MKSSRIGRKPIPLNNVQVNVGEPFQVTGPLGSLTLNVPSVIKLKLHQTILKVIPFFSNQRTSAIQGTVRALISNMVSGVTVGFRKVLVLNGVGFRASIRNNMLTLSLGFSHPIIYCVNRNVKLHLISPNELEVFGVDKQLVGQVSAEIKSFHPIEPYKGKGIRFINETVNLKERTKKK